MFGKEKYLKELTEFYEKQNKQLEFEAKELNERLDRFIKLFWSERIAKEKLLLQIKQMANCHNCKHSGFHQYSACDNGVCCELKDCFCYDKWELQ